MTDEIRGIIKVASIYIATIIGAGFASGQEIIQFFSSYYEGGFYGIILAGLLFSVIGYIVLGKVYSERIRNYDEFLFPTVGWFIGWIMEIAVTLFMVCLFCVMIAGLGNVCSDKFGIPFYYSVAVAAVMCMIMLLTDIKGIMALSTVVTPVLIMGILIIGLYILIYRDTSVFNISHNFNWMTKNWFFSALIYVSYNSILSIVVMCSLLPYLKTKRIGTMGGILGGVMLCFIAFILNLAISMFYPGVISEEIPVLSIIQKYNGMLGGIYTIILWLAMFISAITSGYCFIDRVKSKVKINPKLLTVMFCILIIPLSIQGFSNLISTIYPIFGYIGLFMIIAILMQGIKLRTVLGGMKKLRGSGKK